MAEAIFLEVSKFYHRKRVFLNIKTGIFQLIHNFGVLFKKLNKYFVVLP